MRRVLRNYLISFLIIGLFFLAVHLINRYVEAHYPEAAAPEAKRGAMVQAGADGECERKLSR